MAALIGTGATVTFSSGIVAEPLNISLSGATREQIDSSHMATVGGRTYLPGSLFDPGVVEIEAIMDDPDADFDGIMTAAAETITVTFSNGNTWAASGSIQDFGFSVPLEDRMTFTMSLKLSGNWTHAAS